jgi:hypothetical protein
MSRLIEIITSADPETRNLSLDAFCRKASLPELVAECTQLDSFRRHSDNLYERVRALFFLYAVHRFHIPLKSQPGGAAIAFAGYESLLKRRFEEALEIFLRAQAATGPGGSISSALAAAYRALGFQTLADQVRRSVRSVRGNQWMFRTGHPDDYPLRIRQELVKRGNSPVFPILHESTPVRMDLSHSGWSDIFFLGMDFPEGARVLNISIDLAVRGHGAGSPTPPVESFLRVIDEPVLRLTSVDLQCTADLRTIAEVFDFGADYLGLLRAAVIASGLIPPGLEGGSQPLSEVLRQLLGAPGLGIELVSKVNDIPKGSRLAVSTTLLASLIAVVMRATSQIGTLVGSVDESDRRLVAARAILGEWLGGSGGGWQDSGGVWPGIKLIQGEIAAEGDPEFGISRGCLLPRHRVLNDGEVSRETREKLQSSLVLVHGGMAQDVGPILEMVTERYLLRSEAEWRARLEAMRIFDDVVDRLCTGDVRRIGDCTGRNFKGPIQTIIPWAGNHYTQSLIESARADMGSDFWGFWMLGGMSGGGMGFLFDPRRKASAQDRIAEIMRETKQRLEAAVPFAMEPVVYDFAINERGTHAELLSGDSALMPVEYYLVIAPALLRTEMRLMTQTRRADLDRFSTACNRNSAFAGAVQGLFERLLPRAAEQRGDKIQTLEVLLDRYGFDRAGHEEIQANLRAGRIGLAQNRLAVNVTITDVERDDVVDARRPLAASYRNTGADAIASGAVAVVSLAGGIGTRWTKGAGVVKALNPFARLAGGHRSFIEVHLAKSLRVSREFGAHLPHVITTSYLTHDATESYLRMEGNYGYPGPVLLSPGKSIGLRMVPMERDLRFAWEEMPQQILDEQAQKVRQSIRAALIGWVKQACEGGNYTDNLPLQCLHPVGHWYELPNMMRNGVLARLLENRPSLRYLMVHNIDTVGADVDPALLGMHIESGAAMTTEVVERFVEDRGGGLARVDGRLRLVEGLALPSEEIESSLSFYNSNTMWVDIDQVLGVFGLTRQDLGNESKVQRQVRTLAARMPTYITLKDVKKRWGKGQEDVFPVAQFEKLWGDMTALPELKCAYVAVPRVRGQQLKEPAQLDGWLRDGSGAYVESLCEWSAVPSLAVVPGD